jgi:hypothetical protein
MKASEIFEFLDYLEKPYMKKTEDIFLIQCVTPKEFTEFKNTFLGTQSQDYLSYLTASALIDGTIPNDEKGHLKFLRIANGLSERFFRNTIHHAYNLSIINDKEEIFDNMIITAIDYEESNKNIAKEYNEIQFRDYIHNMIMEKQLDPKFFELQDYSLYHKKLQSEFLKNQLNEELDTKQTVKKTPKI